jgi:NTE family protein
MMRKIKSLQFIRDVYSKEKSIAYFSIDWEYDKCIEYFIRAIKENKIQQEVLDVHDFSRSHIDEIINNNFTEALEHIKQRINYKKIIERGVSDKERIIVSKIKTNLTALTKKEIELLSNHASVLVELQLNLYCPTFITR